MGAVTAQQSATVLNVFATELENNLVTGQVVDWNEHDGELDDLNRLQVYEQVGPRYTVTRTEGGVKDLSGGTDGTVFGSELFEVTGTFNANMGWSDFAAIQTIGAARKSKALQGAASSMAHKIDAYILSVATLASNNWVGNPANSVADYIDAAAAATRMKEDGVDEMNMNFVMNYTDQMLLGDQVINLTAPDQFATTTYKQGYKSQIGGTDTFFTNQLPVIGVGSRAASAASQVDGANQNVDYVDVAKSTAQGFYKSQELDIKGLTTGQTIVAGEVFEIATVFAYDNRKQALVQPPRLQQFTVITGDVADGSGLATVRIFPAIITPGSGAGENVNINTAQATVGSVPANSAAITWKGTASTSYAPRLLIQKDAIEVLTVPLVMPVNDFALRRKLPNIPLTVRMWQHSDFETGAHGVRFDVAMNANVRNRLGVGRFNGA